MYVELLYGNEMGGWYEREGGERRGDSSVVIEF